MKTLKEHIVEGLKIGTKTKVYKSTPVLDDILAHFEFDNLYEIDTERLRTEPYITKEEGETIKNALQEFIDQNDIDKNQLMYYTGSRNRVKDPKIAKDYKENSSTMRRLSSNLHFAKDNNEIFKKKSLRFETSAEKKMIAMFGPLGGTKICKYGE